MVLAVIPARGGSKGIPRKNVRLMKGRPLIAYSIRNAMECRWIDDVVVSSDDEEIRKIAENCGAEVMDRDSALAQDAVTLDPVIFDALRRMEQKKGYTYDVVVTLQATSPLLSARTLDRAMESFLTSEWDTYISAVNAPHLSWTLRGGVCVPNYEKRLNRQQLPPNYLETGAFLITRRECVTENGRIGHKINVYEMPEEEAVDIDTMEDWILCEHALNKKRIVFRADGYKERGMGHIYHCLTLAYHLTGHEIMFVSLRRHEEGVEKLREAHMPLYIIDREEDFYSFLEDWKPDVVVNDCLDTQKEYMQELKKRVKRVVTIEDVGPGARYADVVINALYEDVRPGESYYWGADYVCLRDEFELAKPGIYREHAEQIAVIFGGTDPSNFTRRIYELADRIHENYPGLVFHFIAGSGYDLKENGIESRPEQGIVVEQNVKRISEIFAASDIAFTSQGRTVYELAAMGVPAIVMAQNEREMRHTFAQMNNGFLNLGLGSRVSDETIEHTLRFLLDTPQIRSEMRKLMLRHNLKKGIDRVVGLILQDPEQ